MEIIRNILEKNLYCNLSTVDENGMPWGAPVYFVYDDKLNFYWWSDTESRHSKNIETNQKVFITVYNSHDPVGRGHGLYIESAAEKVNVEQLDRVRDIFNSRLGDQALPHEKSSPISAMQFYKAVPKKWWHNTTSMREDDMVIVREEIKL